MLSPCESIQHVVPHGVTKGDIMMPAGPQLFACIASLLLVGTLRTKQLHHLHLHLRFWPGKVFITEITVVLLIKSFKLWVPCTWRAPARRQDVIHESEKAFLSTLNTQDAHDWHLADCSCSVIMHMLWNGRSLTCNSFIQLEGPVKSKS